jgi:endo-1,4-beta-xylanase
VTHISAIMVSFTQLVLALSAIASTLAAPASDFIGPAVAERDVPDFQLGGANLARRQDYTQNYKTGGNVNFQSQSNGYSVTFSGAGDFVVGKGWSKGTNR